MVLSSPADATQGTGHDHGFHTLRVRAVVPETDDTSSLVLDIPAELRDGYDYQPGQFLTFRCHIDGTPHLRCYSMSSSPTVDDQLQVTVKRMPDGVVSNWMLDWLAPGAAVETTFPAGVFGRRTHAGDIMAFAGGSGITPILSILKSVLLDTSQRARLFYANRDAGGVIFDSALRDLREQSGDRLEVVHHLDADRGLVDHDEVIEFAGDAPGTDCYVCGPAPFMEVVGSALVRCGADADAIHIERFTPADAGLPAAAVPRPEGGPARVTVELDRRIDVAEHRSGTTILQTARQLGMSPPFSCESGNCATCMARLVDGEVRMMANNALTDDEVADGWILTCQAVPTTPTVHVAYE
ncbi:MAG: ferredoxin--NADP reductase [Acidimicrobiales bacterium]